MRTVRSARRRTARAWARRRERRSSSRIHDVAGASPAESSKRNLCAHTTTGRQNRRSTATIITTIARSARATARRSPCSTATLMYAPMPGSRKSLSPSWKASFTIRKNQPPAIESMPFHTRPGAAAGTSSRRNTVGRGQPAMAHASRNGSGTVFREL